MPDVFISYKKEDQARIEPIARGLAQAGYEVWWDHRIPAGRTYRDVIGAAIAQAKCVIVIWSKLSVRAQWVLDEADEGKRRNVLLPITIDEVEPPMGFRQIEAARLIGWTGDARYSEWSHVIEAVAHFVGRARGGAPKPLANPSTQVRCGEPAPPVRRGAGGFIAAVALAAVLGAGAFELWRRGYGPAREPVAEFAVPVTTVDAAPAPTEVYSTGPLPGNAPPPTAQPEPAAAPTCRQGYVWREAHPSDFVCVTPDSRERVRQENALAASRVQPGGGDYGPATCLPGFVWRVAFESDLVCVEPRVRDLVLEENALAASRTN